MKMAFAGAVLSGTAGSTGCSDTRDCNNAAYYYDEYHVSVNEIEDDRKQMILTHEGGDKYRVIGSKSSYGNNFFVWENGIWKTLEGPERSEIEKTARKAYKKCPAD